MKGMTHTPFALLGIAVLFTLFAVPLNYTPDQAVQDVKTVESSNADAKNIESSFENTLGLAAANYVESANQYVVDNGFVSDAESSIAFPDSEFSGNSITYTNYSELTSQLKNTPGLEYSHSNQVLDTGLELEAEVDVNYNFTQAASDITYRHDSNLQSFEGLKGPDPLLTNASSQSFEYSYCGFDRPAEQLGSASGSGVAHGYAAVEPEIGEVDHTRSRILVTENASTYGSIPDDFSGVVTAQGSIDSGNYAEIEGLNLNVTEGSSIILDNGQAWRSHFREMIDNNCYVENPNAPGVLNRMDGSFAAESQGMTTFTDEGDSTQPNEAYLYYNSSAPTLVGVSGVTSGDYGDFRPEFRISEDNRDEWDLADIS
ncbi:hypothetical protein GLU60_03195 [Nanohaloarchaea archaeon H01]|nr:hypothetical protein [Nanohaloarchaea archaeon H01]